MNKRYLFFASLSYSFSILRPLQEEIHRRGGEAAWFLEPTCENGLVSGERQLKTFEEVMAYDPVAIFAPGNHVYDFFPGVKVQVFHGYALNKRAEKMDDHFKVRGWFDMYCTQGPSSTLPFRRLEEEKGNFKVYETGWPKVDPFFDGTPEPCKKRPTILYATTFTKGITSAFELYETIEELIKTKPWDWILTLHPKLNDADLVGRYRSLGETYPNATFVRPLDGVETFRRIDAMLCDSSSIIVEVEMLGKPVVTLRNTAPGPHLIDVQQPEEVASALELALTRPPELLRAMDEYTLYHEAHRDGHNSARILDAVDDFIANYRGRIKRKPLNLFRKLQLRKKLGHYKWRI